MSAVINKMDMQQIEFRAVIKFLTKQGKGPQAILTEMKGVYGARCPGKTMIYKWCSLFQEGREMIEDKPRALNLKRRRTDPTDCSDSADPTDCTDTTDHTKPTQCAHLTDCTETTNLKHCTDPTQLTQSVFIQLEQPQQEIFREEFDIFDDEAFIDEIQNELLDAEL